MYSPTAAFFVAPRGRQFVQRNPRKRPEKRTSAEGSRRLQVRRKKLKSETEGGKSPRIQHLNSQVGAIIARKNKKNIVKGT